LRILAAAINTALPLIMLIVLFTFSARGESYSIENILNIRTAVPEGKGNFMGTNLPVYLGKGQAAFRAEGGEGQEGIYIYKDGVITRAVDGNTVLVEEGGTIRKIGNPVSLGGGGFAFIAESESGEAGIYEYRNGTVDVLLDNRTENKSSEAKFQGFRDLKPADKDSLTFTADTGGRSRALYLLNKTKLTLIASTNTEMPGSKDKFKKLGNPVSIGGGDMVFTARGVKGSGLYRYSKGKVTEVAGTNTALSGQGDKAVTLDSISRDPLVLNNGDVVFQASGAGGVRGIYAAGEGGVRVIADTSTPIPVGEGDFTKFVRSETLVGGGVVFKASGKDKQNGIYVSKGGSIFLVADKNMDLPVGNGKFRYFGDFMPAEEGNFLFFAEGYEGQIGLYEAVYGGK
jgi:hypothetical protein